jgi:uncharacterized membrane protein
MEERTVAEDEADERATHRLIMFSDGVVAIAITLLAIDLPLPEGSTSGGLWTSAHSHEGLYAAFVVSFMVIAASWSSHREVFRYVERTDTLLSVSNNVWLFAIVLNPFATRLLTANSRGALDVHALGFGFYALLQLLAYAALLVILRHTGSHELAPAAPAGSGVHAARTAYGIMLGFGLSIPLFFATRFAWVLWFVAPVLTSAFYRWRAGNDGASL